MAAIKSYSDLQQSKALNKILSGESADIVYVPTTDLKGNEYYYVNFLNDEPIFEGCIYAWSLAALLDILPQINGLKPIVDLEECSIQYTGIDLYVVSGNIVDACYEIVIKLHELKKL